MRTCEEQMHGDLINMTAELADAALAPISKTLLQQLSGILAKANEQISAMQEAMPKDNVVMHPRR